MDKARKSHLIFKVNRLNFSVQYFLHSIVLYCFPPHWAVHNLLNFFYNFKTELFSDETKDARLKCHFHCKKFRLIGGDNTVSLQMSFAWNKFLLLINAINLFVWMHPSKPIDCMIKPSSFTVKVFLATSTDTVFNGAEEIETIQI